MCRFAVYFSPRKPILLADLLTRPTHSVVKQSYDCKERSTNINADGFGIAWYTTNCKVNEGSCLFTSILPAWNDTNLWRISEKILSSVVFAHVRAASPGTGVSKLNCHPFIYGKYTFMHNGSIGLFPKMRKAVSNCLSPNLYESLSGTTDSEHAFRLFLNQLNSNSPFKQSEYEKPQTLLAAFKGMIGHIIYIQKQLNLKCASLLNFAVTDGNTILVSRIIVSTNAELYQKKSSQRSNIRNNSSNNSNRSNNSSNNSNDNEQKEKDTDLNSSSSSNSNSNSNSNSKNSKSKSKSHSKNLQTQNKMKLIRNQNKIVRCEFTNHDYSATSLYFSCGSMFAKCSDGEYRMRHINMNEDVIIVASERLTSVSEDWMEVPSNHILLVSNQSNVLLLPVNVERELKRFERSLNRNPRNKINKQKVVLINDKKFDSAQGYNAVTPF